MMNSLREYLELEFIEKKVDPEDRKYFFDEAYNWQKYDHTTLPHYLPDLPKQKNYFDCGLFVLQYAESFLFEPGFIMKDLQ